MINSKNICILIPAYNEEKNIARVVRSVRDLGYAVIVVDDGSKDQSAEVAKKLGATVVSYQPNHGKGYALRQGIQWFLGQPSYEAILMMDSDGQHDTADLPAFIRVLQTGEAGLVVGDRMHNPVGMPWIRRATNGLMSALISLLSGNHVPDTQCGYRAMTREAAQKIRLKTDRFEIESEMLLEAGRRKVKTVSVPIRSVYEGGASHIRPLRDTVRFFSFLFRYAFSK